LELRKHHHGTRAMALHSHGAAPHDANVSVPAHWFPSAKLRASKPSAGARQRGVTCHCQALLYYQQRLL
jgi:hypothetical protein